MNIDVVPSALPPEVAAEVTELAQAATESDGVAPLNEHTLLHLRGSHPGEQHLLARSSDGSLVGYAHLVPDGSAEVVVAPKSRRQGVGTALVRAFDPRAELKLWAHGRADGADAFAAHLGLTPTRELFLMRRHRGTPLPDKPFPDGFGVRTFRPGADDAAWLEVNARAFADHPEQGSWQAEDLAERLEQPWFDPAGFFLAVDEDAGRLAGFHWTKVHPGSVGEVYVLGLDPAYQGSGVAKPLVITGVRHLHDRGLPIVELYVDGTNTAARAMYEWLGFQTAAVDVQYTRV